jgi:hypothetical protein
VNYEELWAAPVRRRRGCPASGLPKRVKDWPPAARREFERVKNVLWSWVKKNNVAYRGGLGLVAYTAVEQAWSGDPIRVIECNTMEELWETISSLKSED